MTSFLNSWASGVVVAVVIGTIVEMILPEGNSKKYIKTVIGTFILFTIISPVIANFSGGIDLKNIINFEEYSDLAVTASSNIIQDDDILKVYKANMEKDITDTLKQSGYRVLKIHIDVSSSEENYGNITDIELEIEEDNSKIEKINISNKENRKNYISEEAKMDIINLLNSTYGVAKDKINIVG